MLDNIHGSFYLILCDFQINNNILSNKLILFKKEMLPLEWQYHTWASLRESKGYPPRKILDPGSSPSGRGLFGKIFSPFRKIWAKNPKSPPLAWKFWKIFEILVKESKGYPPLRGQKIYPPPNKKPKKSSPRNILSKSLPPQSQVLAHVWPVSTNIFTQKFKVRRSWFLNEY